MTNFLKNRRSVREFRNKPVSSDLLEEVRNYLGTLNNGKSGVNVNFSLYERGDLIYNKLKGIGGYSGVMIESPHYISLELLDNKEKSIIYGAYLMEQIISLLTNIGLGTCWVSIEDVDRDVKNTLFGGIRGDIKYLLAFGHGKRKNPFINESFSERIGVEELVFDEKIGNYASGEDLENRGLGDLFYYIRFAPSSLNRQPWRFLLEKDKVKLLLKYDNIEELNLMDAGVIMYYFEALRETIGIESKWELIEGLEVEEGKDKYKYIGEIKL